MAAVQLQHDSAAPRQAGDVRRAQRERLDQRRQAVRVVGQTESLGQVGGVARSGFVPRDDRELVGQAGELRPPDASVLGGAMDQHQRRALAEALVGDLKPVRTNDLHRRNLHASQGHTVLYAARPRP